MLEEASFFSRIKDYSYLKDSLGLKSEACLAGQRPKTTPTVKDEKKAIKIAFNESPIGQSKALPTPQLTAPATMIPIQPPKRQMTMASIKN